MAEEKQNREIIKLEKEIENQQIRNDKERLELEESKKKSEIEIELLKLKVEREQVEVEALKNGNKTSIFDNICKIVQLVVQFVAGVVVPMVILGKDINGGWWSRPALSTIIRPKVQ